MLKVDYTLIIQIANFLLLLFVLNVILYKPIRQMLRQRREKVDSFQKTRDDFLTRSQQVERELDENIQDARRTGYKTKEELKSEGLEEEKGMLQQAGISSNEKVQKAQQEIEKSMAHVRQSLESELVMFSRELAEKVLGRSI